MIMDGQEALDVASSAGNCDATCSGSFNYSQEAMAKAMVEWINGRGGLAGHRVELAIYRLRLADIATRGGSALASEACQYWTQDRRVSALVLTNLVVEDFVACAARAGVPIMNGDYSNYVPDRQELRGHGRFDYASANFNLDDIARHYVNALVQQGFLKPGNKIGLIYKETPIYQRVIRNTLERELARHGLALAARGGWTDDKQSDQATWNNYVLNFKSKGVDRVLSFGGWVFGMAPFSKAAENQEYRPRYGVSSFTGPADAKVHGVPPRQLIGAQGVGWWPFADVIHKGDAAAFNPAAAECKKIIIGADQPWSALTYRNAMKFCDNFFLLKTLADKAGSVSQPAFYAAADRLGKAFTSPYMWETTFRPGDHHGATYLRNLGYDESCECFAYSGEKYLPRW